VTQKGPKLDGWKREHQKNSGKLHKQKEKKKLKSTPGGQLRTVSQTFILKLKAAGGGWKKMETRADDLVDPRP